MKFLPTVKFNIEDDDGQNELVVVGWTDLAICANGSTCCNPRNNESSDTYQGVSLDFVGSVGYCAHCVMKWDAEMLISTGTRPKRAESELALMKAAVQYVRTYEI